MPDWQEIEKAEELTLKPIKNIKLDVTIGLAYKKNKKNTSLISAMSKVCQETSVLEMTK